MAVTISERLAGGDNKEEFYRRLLEGASSNIRVAIPGIVFEFDPNTQTASVQVAIRERIIDADLKQKWIEVPLLLDVPIIIPRAGGFALTLPVKAGDECLVIFADMCMDAWFSSGGVQNQIERRRHDLSDGFAILGPWSQPRKLSNYSQTAAQLRSEDGQTVISLSPGKIDINASDVRVNGRSIVP
ncbi:Gp138 family membrane-puncturing spike protein [Paenibacillus filicis]|uniref:Gp138 family membrane-puncturing spike protein n=1 Tax=Paenibacillus filicis TaxID=669464 RepID=A0ABU9DIH2_9BACL